MSRLLLQVSAAAIVMGFGASAQGAVGRTPGAFQVSGSGGATYTIPIAVPPGPRGIQPNLAVVYGSHAGSESLGVGWSIAGLSAITRCNRTYAQDAGLPAPVTLTYSDAFCLDGQRLRITSGSLASYGQDLTTYQTEIANFSNVTAHGTAGSGPAYFTVQGRNGLTYEYGNGGNSQVLATGTSTASAWFLNKVTDRANNRMVITYLAPSASLTGTTLPSTISWTASSAGASTFNYTLTFNYSTVAEVLYAAYVANTAIFNQNLLTNITIANSGGSTIKRYAFGYGASQANGRTRLTQVKECADSAEQDCLLPTVISYQNGQAGVTATPVTAAATAGGVYTRYDFNSDGFDDLLFLNGGTGSTWYVELGSASGYGSPVSTGIVDTNLFTVGDILGTGQDAILVNNSGTLYAYLWNDATQSFAGSSTGVAASTLNYGTHLIDVNGDGLADIVTVFTTTSGSGTETTYSFHVTTRLNTSSSGSLSFSSTVSDVTQYSCLRCSFEYYVPFRNSGPLKQWDFDGDGRGDFLFYKAQIVGSTINYVLYKLLGAGTNFAQVQEAGPTTASVAPPFVLNWNNDSCSDIVWLVARISACGGATTTGMPVAGTRATVMDWDGDGRMDLVVSNGTTLGVYLSTGTGISSLQSTSVPYSSSCVYSAADIDGDGQQDLLCWNQSGSTPVSYYLHNAAGQPPDLVTSITDGYGINVSPSYVSTARGSYSRGTAPSYPEQYVTKPFYVVSQATASDGTGSTYTQTFSYTGARSDARGYGFEGFQSLSVTDSRANSLVKSTSFQTAFPYTGMLATEDVFQNNGSTLVSHASLTNSKTDLSTDSGNQRAFVFAQAATVQRYEVGGPKNGLQISTAATSYTYDGYGNATNVATTLTDNDATSPYVGQQWTTTTAVTITPSSGSNWCLTQPTQVVVTNTAPGAAAIARTTGFTPDYTNCRPTQAVTEPGSGTYAVTRVFGYDSFGNVNSLTTTGAGMSARVTSASWGTTGQFPMTVNNALSQASQFGYDFNLGVRTSATDPNGVSTTWQYDTFARRNRENRADGTFTVWSYDDCTSAGGCLVGSHALALWATEYNANSTFLTDSRTYFDQLDRPLLSMTRQFGGVYDRNEVRYDNFGRVVNEYVPCTWTALGTPCPYSVTSTFDALGRTTQVSRPVSASDSTVQTTTVLYAGRTTVATDPNGKNSTQIVTVAGTAGRIQDHDGYAQNFTSDAFGSLLGVADSAGNTLFSAAYDYGIDAFQRDAIDTDLDVSTAAGQHRHYNYNALGELTSWSDAKGQSFSQTYDALSRPLVRAEPDLTTTWTWGSSSANHNIGELQSVSAGSYSEAYSFDNIGRKSSRTITIPSDASYTFDYAYNAVSGLLDTLTYPTSTSSYRLKLQYGYQNGILQSVSDFNAPSTVFWTANALNARGQVTQETLGNGVVTNRALDALTGWLSAVQSGVGGGTALQNESYLFDRVGNVTQRQNNNVLLTETFFYDNLYRLEHSTLGGTPNLALTYFANGNIQSRSDVAGGATWTYGSSRQHAVTQAGNAAHTYSYDANGNAISRDGLSIGWTSFNHPSSINGLNQYDGSSESVQFSYDHNHERWRAVYSGSTGVETTYLIGGLLEKVISAGSTDFRHYIFAGDTKIAIYSRTLGGVNTLRYVREDHLGSAAAILNSDGTSYVKESFTAFGNRRSTCTWSGNPTAGNLDRINAVTRHGYTWHTALGAMGLNDMNGRIQDAITGRFLSPDPYVTDPMFTQGYNRYSYVNNNPLSYTDPTGFVPEAPKDDKPKDDWQRGVAGILNNIFSGGTGAQSAVSPWSGGYVMLFTPGGWGALQSLYTQPGGLVTGGGGIQHPTVAPKPVVTPRLPAPQGQASMGDALVYGMACGRLGNCNRPYKADGYLDVLAVGGVLAGALVGPEALFAALANPATTTTIVVGAADAAAGGVLGANALVVRGGNAANQTAAKINAAIGPSRTPGVTGFSAQCNGGTCLSELGQFLRNKQVGVTTVGEIRQLGGDVIATPGFGNHVTVTGITGEAASPLFRIAPNPNPLVGP